LAGWFHIAAFIDGARRTGVLVRSMALRMSVTTSSVRPWARRAMQSMVQGATIAAWAERARLMC
jgi:hypothetical protein